MESRLELTFTGSVTEVVTPHIGWDGNGHWVVDVGAGTDMLTMGSDDLMKSSCPSEALKGYDVLKVKEYNFEEAPAVIATGKKCCLAFLSTHY